MRKLLVASQKGGVGKTTTSINVAAATAQAGARVLLLDADPLSSISSSLNLGQHPQRQTLRQAGVDLPGVLATNVIPGLDVLSPYENGGCSDDDMDQLLALLATPIFQDGYGCLVVDTPPFLGANPNQLLATADEFILVMRAEPLAYRTLPAFLELVQRSRNNGAAIKMRGILLTLPEGEEPGGRWERELRGRFGTRILANVVPHDEAVAQAVLFGGIVSRSSTDSPAIQAYRALIESLNLAGDARETNAPTATGLALLQGAAALNATEPICKPASREVPVVPAAAVVAPLPPPDKPAQPLLPPEPPRHVYQPEVAAVPVGPDSSETIDLDQSDREEESLDLEPPLPVPAFVRLTPMPPPDEVLAMAAPARQPRPPLAASVSAPPTGQFPLSLGLLWMGLAMVLGVVLRFLHLPDSMIPVLIGVGVAVVVVMVLRNFHKQEPGGRTPPARKPSPRRAENRPDPAKRLSGLKRRVTASARNGREK